MQNLGCDPAKPVDQIINCTYQKPLPSDVIPCYDLITSS